MAKITKKCFNYILRHTRRPVESSRTTKKEDLYEYSFISCKKMDQTNHFWFFQTDMFASYCSEVFG